METFRAYLESLVDFFIANPTATKTQTVDQLQLQANVTNIEGNALMEALHGFYASAGISNTDAFGSWRNSIVNDGATKAKLLILALAPTLGAFPDVAIIGNALLTKTQEDRRAQINEDLTVLRDYRDGLPTPPAITGSMERVIRRAMKDSIQSLLVEKGSIQV